MADIYMVIYCRRFCTFRSCSCSSGRSYVCFCWGYNSQLVAALVLGKIRPSVVFFRCSRNFGHSFAFNWINFSMSVLYLLPSLILSTLCSTEVLLFSAI